LFKIKNRIGAEYQSPYKKKEGKKKSKLNINTTRKKQKNQTKDGVLRFISFHFARFQRKFRRIKIRLFERESRPH